MGGYIRYMKNYRITTLYSVLSLLSTNALADNFESKLVYAAIERTTKSVTYDGSYISISYPNGDVPKNIGVCTDVVIRSYRKLGIDLQKLLHEDIAANFDKYPSKRIWGLNRPDKNIDHRRVPNLQTFLSRQGTSLAISKTPSDYKPGDIVTWMLGGNLPHIGIVTDQEAADGTPMIVHNIGSGPQHENMLFSYTITGHYRFMPN
ncbi:MAG: hypothetical protein ACI9SP_003386 [Arenicella sp.]